VEGLGHEGGNGQSMEVVLALEVVAAAFRCQYGGYIVHSLPLLQLLIC
jgi:hypothetical protein